MLSLILLAFDAPARSLRPEAAARSLASLIEACVHGLVADAVLVGRENPALDKIADEAGCARIESASREDGLARALAVARNDTVFLLESGFAIERGFVDETNDAIAGAPPRALILRAAPNSFVTRLAPRLAPVAGLIASKAALRAVGGADLSHLARKLKGADLSTRARRVC